MANYVYMLRCGDGSLYTGWTNDLKKRIQMHKTGKGAKYTRAHLPVELVYYEEFEEKTDAQKREYALKQLKRPQKEALIRDFPSEELQNQTENQRNTDNTDEV